MSDIVMPALIDGMERGTIVRWLIDDGGAVSRGDELVEIETDKATTAYLAEADGVLQIVAGEGTTLAVGELMARLGAAGDAAAAATPRTNSSTPLAHEPALEPADATNGTVNGTATGAAARATPVARRIAAQHGIALDGLEGTGPHGRILKGDVLSAAGLPAPVAPSTAAVAPASPAAFPTIGGRRVQPTRLQQIVATRMAAAKATVPHFQVQTEAEMDAALALRRQLRELAADGGAVPSINDLIVRACALALRDHPLVNGSFVDGAYELHDAVHIGIAVAAEDGLLVATLRDADTKSLRALATESRDLTARVRAGEATAAELTGATFTVSNLGMFGMTAIVPVINPPQAAILGVGAVRPTLARVAGEIVDRQRLTLTLSCDHRIINGADGSRFLSDVRTLLEQPVRLAF